MKNKYNTGYWICEVISWILNLVPAMVFLIIGFCQADNEQKLTIGVVAIVAGIYLTICLFTKAKLWRTVFSIVFILLLWVGQYIALMCSIVLGCQILDEIVMQRLIKYFGDKRQQRAQAIENAKALQEAAVTINNE